VHPAIPCNEGISREKMQEIRRIREREREREREIMRRRKTI
jgi:hypothetical protein